MKKKTKLLKVLPSLAALKNNVRYKVKQGNEKRAFIMRKRHGISTLLFRRKIRKSKVFNVTIEGKPLHKKDKVTGQTVNLNKIYIKLKVHVV